MKTAIKVFLILSYVAAGFTALDGLLYMNQGNFNFGIAQLISATVVVTVSIIAHQKLRTATCKRDLRTIGIITLLFGNMIAGILMLCISDQELMPKNQQYNPYNNPYGSPYGNPYNGPYGGPYGSPYNQNGPYQNQGNQQQYNPYEQQQQYNPNNQYQNPGNNNPYGSPYGNPTGAPFTAQEPAQPNEEPIQPTEENQNDTPTDQE